MMLWKEISSLAPQLIWYCACMSLYDCLDEYMWITFSSNKHTVKLYYQLDLIFWIRYFESWFRCQDTWTTKNPFMEDGKVIVKGVCGLIRFEKSFQTKLNDISDSIWFRSVSPNHNHFRRKKTKLFRTYFYVWINYLTTFSKEKNLTGFLFNQTQFNNNSRTM